jgi:hypothetical protein
MADPKDNFDSDDVPAALKRETSDGPGFKDEEELPESDFVSFAEDGVESDEETDK